MKREVPAELDWVTARSQCSLISVFERLKIGVEQDAAIRHGLPGEEFGYSFGANGGSFWVALTTFEHKHVVRFTRGDRSISVSMDDSPFLEGGFTLCDDGVCRISVNDEPLELWQFRRRALERLFFGFAMKGKS